MMSKRTRNIEKAVNAVGGAKLDMQLFTDKIGVHWVQGLNQYVVIITYEGHSQARGVMPDQPCNPGACLVARVLTNGLNHPDISQ